MARTEPYRTILDLLRVVPAVDCQNRLLNVSDRDLSMALIHASDRECDQVLSYVGAGKSHRVRLEIARCRRSRTQYLHYERAVAVVVKALQGARITTPKSYYRPSRVSKPR
ncbi:MAG: hypothetical protein ACOCYB_09700 [Alkalispirochaeta sp.]